MSPGLGYVKGGVLASKFRCPLINSVQLEVGCVNTDGGMDGQRKLEFVPSLGKDSNELKKPPFPNGARKYFDEDLFPETTKLGTKMPKSGVHLLQIRIASVRALLYVFCNGFAKLL